MDDSTCGHPASRPIQDAVPVFSVITYSSLLIEIPFAATSSGLKLRKFSCNGTTGDKPVFMTPALDS